MIPPRSRLLEPLVIVIVIILFGVGLVARFVVAGKLLHPGHGDSSFYYTVAENMAQGRGAVVDYRWHYLGLNHPANPSTSTATITHPAFDYWLPLTSLIISASMGILGISLFAALVPSILFGVGLAAVTYGLATSYTPSRLVAVGSAVLVFLLPTPFFFSLQTDTTIYYTVFASLSLLAMVRGMNYPHPWWFLLAAVGAGLAHLTRQDGVLLFVLFAGVAWCSPHPRRTRAAVLLAGTGIYLLTLAPLLGYNLRTFGALTPPGVSSLVFLTDYEDLYSFAKDLSLHSYLQWGIGNILWSKFDAILQHIMFLRTFLGLLLWPFVIAGLFDMLWSKEQSPHRKTFCAIHGLFLGILILFFAFVATFPGIGSFFRSGVALVPFLCVIAIDTIHRRVPSQRFAIALVVILLVFTGGRSMVKAHTMLRDAATMAEQLEAVEAVIRDDASQSGQEPIVIMTRLPWQVYHSMRLPVIQIPNDDLETIYDVAGRFRATYLLLPAPREALWPLYTGEVEDRRFRLVASVPNSGFKVFRIR
ncbi:MAG: hypothetical protein HC884_03575 [Chloroflexaceae bacterium]|nr:hypothetical protein [Chloroflexaceae bacterium]